jgi:hypothetical protein
MCEHDRGCDMGFMLITRQRYVSKQSVEFVYDMPCWKEFPIGLKG